MKKMNKIKRRKYQETHNLLSGATEKEEDREKSGTVEYLSHWHGNLTISLVYDQTNWPQGKNTETPRRKPKPAKLLPPGEML